MGNTWVADMSQFDYGDDEVHELPAKALNLWRYFGAITEASLIKPLCSTATGLPCRRRPGRAPCTGVIESEIHPDGNQLHWWCPICDDNGHISNWEGTRWAPSRKSKVIPFPKSAQLSSESAQSLRILSLDEIQGTIECNGKQEGGLPKIVTGERSYTWDELGRELMTCEGFNISMKMR